MDPITQQTVIAAAGAGGGDPVYVDDVFSTYLYGGNDTGQSINNGIDLAGEGGLVWIKRRDGSGENYFIDTERGRAKHLRSNTSAAEGSSPATNDLTSFNNNGFTLGVTYHNTNYVSPGNPCTYASWSFRKAPGFFDVVTYTGNSSTGQVINHSLGSVPGCIIIKRTDSTSDWYVYHVGHSFAPGEGLALNLNASGSSTYRALQSVPTSTTFTAYAANTNTDGATYVAYIFAHDEPVFGTDEDESIIKCGSYTGNGSFIEIDCGWEAQWVLVKRANSTGDWSITDSMRGLTVSGQASYTLFSNLTNGENDSVYYPNSSSKGFTAGNSDTGTPGAFNTSGAIYIYMAIRRPHKPPEVGTDVFAMDYGNYPTIPTWDSGFPVDFAIFRALTIYGSKFASRLTGDKYMRTNSTNAEASDGSLIWDSSLGWGKDYPIAHLSWMFKRAPGFFDVVAYTGTGSVRTVSHNLNAVPELMIFKSRNTASTNWAVRCNMTSTSVHESVLQLNNGGSTRGYGVGGSPNWESLSAQPTSTVINIASSNELNASGRTFIGLLFATLPGISKVGSYTGLNSAQNIDCGFTNGARFVLIKRTNGSSGWHLWDTTRGIVTGNDPYIRLENDGAQTTTTDHIDPLNAGFTVTYTNEADINAAGGEYIFLAIA